VARTVPADSISTWWYYMKEILRIIPVVLYCMVGAICLIMAFKNFLADAYLPFHEKVAGTSWKEIGNPLQILILALMRISALGFLIISILLLVYPIVNLFMPGLFYQLSIPVIALIYSSGLLIINFSLYRKTGTDTPWKGSLYAALLILAGIIISIFNN
jgi:hypothetical protein